MSDLRMTALAALIGGVSASKYVLCYLPETMRVYGKPYYHRIVSPYVLSGKHFRNMAYKLHGRHSGGTVYSANDLAVAPLDKMRVIWRR